MTSARPSTTMASRSAARALDPADKCTLFLPGHQVHYLQTMANSSVPPQPGRITSISGGAVVVQFPDETRRYRIHSTNGLRSAVARGGSNVAVDESRRLLLVPQPDDSDHLVHAPDVVTDRLHYGFSVALAGDTWRRCRTDPEVRFDAVSPKERGRTHGGSTAPGTEFTVSGTIRWIAEGRTGHPGTLALWMGFGSFWVIELTPTTEYWHRDHRPATSADLAVGALVEVSGRTEEPLLTATSVTL